MVAFLTPIIAPKVLSMVLRMVTFSSLGLSPTSTVTELVPELG